MTTSMLKINIKNIDNNFNDSLPMNLYNLFDETKLQIPLPFQLVHKYFIQTIINVGYRVDAAIINGGWIEIDTVEDLFAEVTLSRLKNIK